MSRRWRLALVFPLVLALGGCLDITGSTMPNDDEEDDNEDPNQQGFVAWDLDTGAEPMVELG